jgi:hypothetical protein
MTFNRLRESFRHMIKDIAHVETVKDWTFDENDQATSAFMRLNSFTVRQLIGYLRGFHAAYYDKLPEQQAVQLENDITSFYFAQRSAEMT